MNIKNYIHSDKSTQFEKCTYHRAKRLDQICLDESCSKKGLYNNY